MGANLVGPIQDVNILISLSFAVFLLGEKLNGIMIIGILLVCFGPVLTWKRGPAKPAARPTTFKPNWGEGILFAAISALAYGTSPILVRLGLSGGSIATSAATWNRWVTTMSR